MMKVKWIPALSYFGMVAYMLTDIIHEVIGHGATCLIIGHKIDLISSVYFKSRPGSFLTDIGGPIANLLSGLLIHTLLKNKKGLSLPITLLLLNLLAYNLCWFSGTILESAFSNSGDWTYAVRELHIGALGKLVLIIAGTIAYLFSISVVRAHANRIGAAFTGFPLKKSIIYSWFAAAISATIAGVCFRHDRANAALEGLLEALGLLPVIVIIPGKQVRSTHQEPGSNPIMIISILILFFIFCLTLGRGIS